MKKTFKSYTPSQKVLENYAHVMVNFAVGNGKGVKKGDVVMVQARDSAKPLYQEIVKAVWKAGGHVLSRYSPDNEPEFNFDKVFYETANDTQVDFSPDKYLKGIVEEVDHSILVLSLNEPRSLMGVDTKKVVRSGVALRSYRDALDKKENEGKFSWTLCLYGTPQMAKEAGLTVEKYWDQIIKACFLDKKNPVQEWKNLYKKLDSYRKKLDNLKIEKLHIEGADVDLWVTIGADRLWKGGGGNNIPSFELFTSPNWRGTNGWIRFNQPLYKYGNLIEGIELEFKDGVVIKSSARKNEKVLKNMIAAENANKVGEFSLTDNRFSTITKFMAHVLFDENIGGPFGNTHIALGSSYQECYRGKVAQVSKEQWKELGFNDSSVHTDIVSTTDRVVTAFLPNGKTKVVYKNGQFIL
jgi:aminopeptidase